MKQKSYSALVFEVIYTLTVIALFSFGITKILNDYGCSETVSILLATGIWVVASFLFLTISVLVRKTKMKEWKLWYYPLFYPLVLAFYMIGTVVFRIIRICNTKWLLSGNLNLFHQAQVLESGSNVPDFWSKPFEAILSVLMNLSMRVFGNCEEAVVFLFLLLQIISLFILIHTVKNIWGKEVSICSLLLISFLPTFSDTIFCVTKLHILILFYVILLYLFSLLIKNKYKNKTVLFWICFIPLHIILGFLLYYELVFVGIFVLEICFFFSKSCYEKVKAGVRRLGVGLLCILTGISGVAALNSMNSNKSIMELLVQYLQWFDFHFEIVWDALIPKQYYCIGICIGVLLVCYMVNCAKKMNVVIISSYIYLLLHMLISFFGLLDESFGFLLIFSYSIMASVSVCMLWKRETEQIIIDEKEITKMDEIKDTEKEANTNTNSINKVKLLDNPLPLPKKHVKKDFDFAIQVEEEKMHFDIDITDQDDYDIQ